MATVVNIPDEDNILRYAKKKHLFWQLDASGNPLEIKNCHHDLFKLRNDAEFLKKNNVPEKSLSVCWVDFFKGDDEQKLNQTVSDFLGPARKLKKFEAFAKLNVGSFKKICDSHKAKIRIIHDAKKSSIKSHSSITQLPQNNSLLLDDLCELALKTIVPAKKFIS